VQLELLVERLAKVLHRDAPTLPAGWVDALMPVALFAGTQESLRFNVGTRLLADLQAGCTLAEREVKVVDFVSWGRSLGRRPIVRPLPATREVRMAKRLHKASARVPACELETAADRERLAEVLHAITAHADANVRASLRPKVEAALDAVGLEPHSLPERVAQKKLVDELLDRGVDVGRLTLGDLRDAISKNDLKLPDLTVEALRSGDQLLRADRVLEGSLDGVYRSGEIYLRFLQKLSSILFGTKVGRFATRFALLPLLGAFAVVEGLQHMIGPLAHKLTGHEPEIATPVTLYGTAAFLFLVLHVVLFRRAVVFVLRWVWRGVRLVLFDAPVALWRLPVVRRIVDSRFNRWVLRPVIPAMIVAFVIVDHGRWRWPIAGASFVASALLFNSRFGRLVEERTADWVILSSQRLTTRFLPGLVRYVLDLFARLADLVDRAMYRVDELLRYRSGQSSVKLVLKGILSVFWSAIAYVLRLYVDLFIEPTTNPIKHFPVVTVAAKILIPFTPAILSGVAGPASKLLGSAMGNSFAAFTVIVLPGLAGFLVWELKENWKLYRASRSKVLERVAIGHHGETMVRLLRPGFHSGTIPKLFTKRRRAAWRHDHRGVARAKEGLHHVEEAVFLFATRRLANMLSEAEAFRATDVAITHVEIGANRIEIDVECPSVGTERASIRIELQAGWLLAGIARLGWITKLDEEQLRVLEVALAGFYKFAAVDLSREQLEQLLTAEGKPTPRYGIAEEGLLVWPGEGFETEVSYDLHSSRLRRRVRGRYDGILPSLRGSHAVFSREPVYWSMWSTAWQQVGRGATPMRVIIGPPLVRR
jgi:hypothetical protein